MKVALNTITITQSINSTEYLSQKMEECGVTYLYLHRKQPLIIILAPHEPMVVQVVTEPYYGTLWFKAGPAQFGYNLKSNPPVSIIHYLLCKQDIRKSTTLRTPRTNEFSIKVVFTNERVFGSTIVPLL